jgi:hypothetical protein
MSKRLVAATHAMLFFFLQLNFQAVERGDARRACCKKNKNLQRHAVLKKASAALLREGERERRK